MANVATADRTPTPIAPAAASGTAAAAVDDQATASTTLASTHRIPVVLDGVRYGPTSPALAGRPLFYVVDRDAQAEGVIYAFHTEAQALDRLTAATSEAVNDNSRSGVSALGDGVVEIFSDIDGNGDWMWQGGNTLQGDLRNVGRGCILGICSGNWNDVISSLRTNGRAIVLYRDLNLTGCGIYFGPWVSANLTDYYCANDGTNWNDQATSLYVYS
jgi:hypothetical protein